MTGVARKTVCCLLAISMALSPAMINVERSAALAAETGGPDLAYITPEAAFAAVAYPQRVLTAPEMEMLPVEVISAMGKKELGIDPVDIESVMVIVEPSGGRTSRLWRGASFFQALPTGRSSAAVGQEHY